MSKPIPRLILGSGSPRRLDLLKQINITPDIVDAPDIVEIPAKDELPRDYVRRLAIEKNQALHNKYPNDFILTGDTTVCVGRRFLEKAQDEDEQRAFMKLLSGRAHHVITAVSLRTPDGRLSTKVSDSRVKFKRLSEAEINAYIKTNDWKGKAGYGIIACEHLISSVHGSYSGILGLPLHETYQLLTGLGYLKI